MKMCFRSPKSLVSRAGFSIAETVVAMGVGAMAVAGGMSLTQQELALVKSARESNGASLALEERVEQLRLANWRQITDSAYIQQQYFAVKPKSAPALGGFSESITIAAFPDSAACTALKMERSASGEIRMLSNGAGLSGQRLAKINVKTTWLGKGNRNRTREFATIISNAGITRMSLPAMGAGSVGTAATSSTTTTTSTDTATTTETPTGTDPDTTATGTTSTTTGNGNGNGNGNGHGNVGGKSGKN